MLRSLFLVGLVGTFAARASAAELVIAETGSTEHRIVLPAKSNSEIIDHWLLISARLMQAAFDKNGVKMEIVAEPAKASGKPGIYLGATEFARQNGVRVEQYDDWTYRIKAIGRDLIIAGRDYPDPRYTVRGSKTPLAQLGTVKGVCDFLRQYVGVRFLFMNMDGHLYTPRTDARGAFNADGSLKLDTRAIGFLAQKRITVPAALDLEKTPLQRANYDHSYETFYNIALNFFPRLSAIEGDEVVWYQVLPTARYARSHPQYFAILKEGKRSCEMKWESDHYIPYCVTNQGAQDLVYQQAEKLIASGQKVISINTMDGFRLCQCNCEECNKLFGMKAGSWEEIRARGRSGKLWQAVFRITERLRQNYPDARVVLLNYQDTPVSADVIKAFPPNVIVKIQFASQLDFDKLQGVQFPAGLCGFEETFTGFGQAGPYLPERTPEHMAEVVRTMARNNVKWTMRDGLMGYVRGLQAPAYYVYGRMLDDPAADWEAIYDEFCEAAFGNTAATMKRFYDLLHMQLAIYSDFFGVFMPAWSRTYSRSCFHDSKWHVMSMFPPEYCAEAESLLASAERAANDPDVKARLHLVRIDFDYAVKLSRIFYLQNAWTMNSSQPYLDPLADAIDDWHAYLKRLAGGDGRATFKVLDDWPEMRPFCGHFYLHAALEAEGYQQQWTKTCLNWDTQAIREGILADKHQLKVSTTDAAPAPDSSAWDNAPQAVLKYRGGMPYANVRTSFKVLKDNRCLYVRVQSRFPHAHPEDLYTRAPDDKLVFNQEYVELAIAPPSSGGKVYRLVVNPVEGSRYDSLCSFDRRSRISDDVQWNGRWQYSIQTNMPKGPWNLNARVWTACFKIPFSDLGAPAPAAGEVWGFNVGRSRASQPMLWSDGSSATDPKTLGQLHF